MNMSRKPPLWFWLVGVLALGWNLVGVMAYVQQMRMTPAVLAALSESHREFLTHVPVWATAAFAIATFGGAAGSLLLLLRSRWAGTILALSLLGVCVQMGHAFLIAHAYDVFGPGGIAMPIMIIVIAVLLVLFARHARRRGWLA